jgi:hypothetical protein
VKNGLAFLLTVTLLLNSFSTYVVGETYDEVAETSVAICEGIGMVIGTGSGVTESYLDSTPARYQGAVMLLRLKGLLNAAMSYSFTGNYTDYQDLSWEPEGHNLLGYLYVNGDVGFAGYPDGTFLPNEKMTAKQYYKLLLESLGYGYGIDYTWDTTGNLLGVMEFSESVGMVWLQDNTDFTIRDLCIATVEGLKTELKDGSKTLAQKLVDEQVIDAVTAQSLGLINVSGAVAKVTANVKNGYETAIITGETLITVEISNATFKENVGDYGTETTSLLAGISGSSWDSFVDLDYWNVTRMSDTTLLIDLGPVSDYRILEDETVTITIPTSILNENIISSPKTTITIDDCGTGTEKDPWELYEPEDFAFVSSNPVTDFDYIMMADMDFTGVSFTSVDLFSGVFDGNDKEISNLNLTAANDYTGMFSRLNNGRVQDLNFMTCTVDSTGNQTGIVASMASGATIINVHIEDSSVTSEYGYTGLIAGVIENDSKIVSSSANDVVVACEHYYSGGLIGYGINSTIDECDVTDAMINQKTYTSDDVYNVGGIIGGTVHCIVKDCEFDGYIYGESEVGGIIGYSDNSYVTDCTSSGKLFGIGSNLGGIVGLAEDVTTITGNYCDLDSINSINLSAFDFTQHRIVGSCDISYTTLDNEASEDTKLYDYTLTDRSENFESDAYGVDGLTD